MYKIKKDLLMKLKEKISHSLGKKMTFMLVPHSNKEIVSFHLSKFEMMFFGAIFSVVLFLGILFAFQLEYKKNEYEHKYLENIYYEKQIGKIRNILPKINNSQTYLSNQLDGLFTSLGVQDENKKTKINATDRSAVNYINRFDKKISFISNYITNFRKLFKDIPSVFPLVARNYFFTSPFGYRRHPIRGTYHLHTGIDISAFPSTPIQATANGEVMLSRRNGGYGLMVKLKHQNGFATKYAHMSRIAVKKGDFIKRGQIVGYVGMSGSATGYHVHYEVILNNKPINPASYLYLNRF